MKKIFLYCLAMAVVLAGCGGKNAAPASKGAASQAAKWIAPEGWSTGRLGAQIYNVWDSKVLPDCVPEEIPGVKVEETRYRHKGAESINGNFSSGNMEFKDADYEEWGVSFECNDEHEAAFIKALEEKNFTGGIWEKGSKDYGTPTIYQWAGNGYYAYLYVSHNFLTQDGYSKSASFSITPAIYALPKTFMGTKLPQAGVALESYDDWEMYAYDKDYNEITADYNLKTDKGNLPAYYAAWFDYACVSDGQMAAYVRQLQAEGWTITYEYGGNGESYSAGLKKGDMHAIVMRDRDMRVGFANIPELLSY